METSVTLLKDFLNCFEREDLSFLRVSSLFFNFPNSPVGDLMHFGASPLGDGLSLSITR